MKTVLAGVERIYAEDTRVTATLLAHFGIAARGTALHAHNEARREGEVIAALAAGMSVAIVTDAGTPAISDPGARIVRAVHEAGFAVVPVAGPSALVAAVSAAGLYAEQFLFAGFLPRQAKARHAFLERFGALPIALVVYEAPHRVRDTLSDLREALGADRAIVIAREITKRFEEIARMRLGDAAAWLAADANRARGEFVLVIDAPPGDHAPAELSADVERWLAALVAEVPPATAARIASAASGVARDALYARATALKHRDR